MKNKLLIPTHKCKNCAECCGPVPINKSEYKEITNFVKKNKPEFNKSATFLECKFNINNKCSIYPVRPILCRLMGVTKGMSCKFGNTKELDGTQFINFTEKQVGLLNEVIKTEY